MSVWISARFPRSPPTMTTVRLPDISERRARLGLEPCVTEDTSHSYPDAEESDGTLWVM